MSRTLTLTEAGWQSILALATAGRHTTALSRLRRYLCRPDIPTARAAAAHRLAGELLLEQQRYAAARRHLRAAVALRPEAGTYYALGLAYERDGDTDAGRALRAFRRAWRLAPDQAIYQAAFGRAAIRAGHPRRGLRAVLGAAAAAPGDLAVLRVVIDGLLIVGRFTAARRVLTRARFLRRHDQELLVLEGRVRFAAARAIRVKHGRVTRPEQDAGFATDGDRVALPFVRPHEPAAAAAGPTGATPAVMPFPRRLALRLRCRNADR